VAARRRGASQDEECEENERAIEPKPPREEVLVEAALPLREPDEKAAVMLRPDVVE
jgi:hypothetical protein